MRREISKCLKEIHFIFWKIDEGKNMPLCSFRDGEVEVEVTQDEEIN